MNDLTEKAEKLRTYARIFAAPKRDANSKLRPPNDIDLSAAEALRFYADALEKQVLLTPVANRLARWKCHFWACLIVRVSS